MGDFERQELEGGVLMSKGFTMLAGQPLKSLTIMSERARVLRFAERT
jgi:hypothetical protein